MKIIQCIGFTLFAAVWLLSEATSSEDLPCIPLAKNNSVVCVCNSTYCDTITRDIPAPGYYVTYTSSKSGLRFNKTRGIMNPYLDLSENYSKVIHLEPETKFQTIEGFGGAVTDSAAMNWKRLSASARQYLINSYCGKDGIEYSMLRVPCGSTDFSSRFWAYNELPVNDTQFTNFTLSPEDELYRVPMIQACMKVATDDIEVISATWSPPAWMLTKEYPTGYNTVNDNFYQSYADYHCKFAELMKENGINIWGMSISNEPLSALLGGPKQEFLSWTGPQLVGLLLEYFGPTIRNCSVEGIKVLAVDDQRYALPLWMLLIDGLRDSMKDVDGIALHFYEDRGTAPGTVVRALSKHPDKFVINTEACTGIIPADVVLGSWDRATSYIESILEDLNYNFVGWLDWNMCLNEQGGPAWLKDYVDSPIIVNSTKDEFYKQPMYYAFGHFSKFIPRGSKRIAALTKPIFTYVEPQLAKIEKEGQSFFDHVAFLTPQGTIVVVVHNGGAHKNVLLTINGLEIPLKLEAESIKTVEMSLPIK